MYISKRTSKKRGIYYSFSYDDEQTGKRVRLALDEHPHFSELSDARAWAKSQAAWRASKKDMIAKKSAWKTQFYDFVPLIEKFTLYQQKEAPNSWESAVFWLEQYALPFFLDIKRQNNVNAWHFLYNDFRTHLIMEGKTLRGSKKLAYSSCNKAIHSLNSFVAFLTKDGLIDSDSSKKCQAFEDALLNTKSFECVIEQTEFDVIHRHLTARHQPTADFFYIAYHTGARFNELFGLPMSFLYSGQLEGPIHEELKSLKLEYYGYLVLESQPDNKIRTRAADHSIKRKALKGRTKIDPKNNRIIPILDKECWNILARRFKSQRALLDKQRYGTDKLNYMLFDDLFYSKPKRELIEAYKGSGYPTKTFHDCRHTYCTLMVGRTRSFFLARAVLGHKSNAFERYLHIYDGMSQRAKQNAQLIEEIS